MSIIPSLIGKSMLDVASALGVTLAGQSAQTLFNNRPNKNLTPAANPSVAGNSLKGWEGYDTDTRPIITIRLLNRSSLGQPNLLVPSSRLLDDIVVNVYENNISWESTPITMLTGMEASISIGYKLSHIYKERIEKPNAIYAIGGL